jgi:hypothetical protein
MKMIGLSTAALMLVTVTACSVRPSDGSRPKIVGDPIAAYKRSQPTAPQPTTLISFGFVEGDAVTVALNPSLAAAQTREHCDQRPVERIATQPRRYLYCRQTTIMGCGEYVMPPGEEQPVCEKTWILNPNACVRRADPNLPTISYRYERDCYKTPARAGIAGQLDIYAVTTGSRSDIVPDSTARLLGSVSLTPTTPTQTVRLADAPRANECLALADRDRRVLSIRQANDRSASQFFITPRMQADRAVAALQAEAAKEQRAVVKLRAELAEAEHAILANVAWQGTACTLPAMAALPPEPQGILPTSELGDHARGYCAILMMSQLTAPERVIEAVMAEQEFDYVEQVKRFKSDPTRPAACTRKSYKFPTAQITRLRGGIESASAALRNGGDIFSSLGAVFEANTIPRQQQNSEIVSLLRSCTATAIQACEQPRLTWQAESERIRAAPQRLAAQCQDDVQQRNDTSTELQQAERRYASAKAIADAAQLNVIPGRIALDDAVCVLN